MINVDTLFAVGLLYNLAEKTQEGVIPLSEIKSPGDACKIIYDDSKPEKCKDYPSLVHYPVVFYDKAHKAWLSYDSLLAGVIVECYVEEHPEQYDHEGNRYAAYRSCSICLTAKDEAGNGVEFGIENGNIGFSVEQ